MSNELTDERVQRDLRKARTTVHPWSPNAVAAYAVALLAARKRVAEQSLALRNVKALAKRLRKDGDSETADHLLRFCAQGGEPDDPLMDILRTMGV